MIVFAVAHPFLTGFLIFCLGYWAVLSYSRTLRAVMVSSRGWPPPHLDADGDWKPSEKETEE